MDILTQGLLGAVLAQAVARQGEAKRAAGIGFFAGLLADADVLIRSSQDSLLAIEYHRHFTHAVFFIPFGALVAALLLWPLLRRRVAFPRIYLFSLLGYSLSGFLDACTSYGTHLFWPLTEARVAFNIISIIDPLFTLTLLLACIYSIRRGGAWVARVGLSVAGAYLLLGWTQLQRAEAVMEGFAQSRGHQLERLVVKPTLGNLLLWRSVYYHDGHFYVDAVRLGVFSASRVYTGGQVQRFRPEQELAGLGETSVLYQDVQRFLSFSDDYVAYHPDHDDVLADIRYSNQPTGLDPLWGIRIDRDQPQQHASFATYRNMSRDKRERFYTMLLGNDL